MLDLERSQTWEDARPWGNSIHEEKLLENDKAWVAMDLGSWKREVIGAVAKVNKWMEAVKAFSRS